MSQCYSALRLINLTGNSKVWTLKLSGNQTSDYLFGGYSGATGNVIHVFSGGGNTSGAFGVPAPDVRAGTVLNFHGNCADISFNIDTVSCARVAGAIVYNSNAALGTLGAAGLVSCQGTAANSWSLMATPTLKY